MGKPAFTCKEVEFGSSGVKAVYPVAERADKIEVRIQLARVDPRCFLTTREFSQRGSTVVAACVVVSHIAIGDRGLRGPSDLVRVRNSG